MGDAIDIVLRLRDQLSEQVQAARAAVKNLGIDVDKVGSLAKAAGEKLEAAFINPMGAIRSLGTSLLSSLSGVSGAVTAAVAGIAGLGAAIFALTSRAAAAGAELDDMADKTGLSVPALSRLSNAAKVAEADMGTLTNAVFILQRNIAEGGEKFATGLGRIGLSLQDLKAAGPDQYLPLIATHLREINDPAERAAAAVEIFGRQGRDILPTLVDLDKALQLTSDIEPWTEEQAAAAERFQMQMRSWLVHIEAVGEKIGRNLIEPVASFISAIVQGIPSVEIFGFRLGDIGKAIDALAAPFEYAAAAVRMFRGEAEQLPKITGSAAQGVEQWKAHVKDMGTIHVPTLTEALAIEGKVTKDLTAQQRALADEQKKAAAAAKEAQKAFDDQLQSMDRFESEGVKAVQAVAAGIDTLRIGALKVSPVLRDMAIALGDVQLAADHTSKSAKALDAELEQTIGLMPDLSGQAAAHMETFRGATESAKGAVIDWRTEFTRLGQDVEGNFAQMLIGVTSFKDGFLNIWGSIKNEFAHILNAMVSSFINGFLAKITGAQSGGGGLGGFLGGLFGGGSSGGGGGGFLGGLFGGGGGGGLTYGPSMEQLAGGGGGFGGGIGSIFGNLKNVIGGGISKIGSSLSSMFTGGFSGFLHALPGIGTIAALGIQFAPQIWSGIKAVGSKIADGFMGMVHGIGRLFGGPSGAELQGRDVEKQFEQQMAQFGVAGTTGLAASQSGLQQQYIGAGMEAVKAAQQAQADFLALFAAEKQGGQAVQAVIDGITQRIAEQKATLQDVAKAAMPAVADAGQVAATETGAGFTTQTEQIQAKLDDIQTTFPGIAQAGQDSALQIGAIWQQQIANIQALLDGMRASMGGFGAAALPGGGFLPIGGIVPSNPNAPIGPGGSSAVSFSGGVHVYIPEGTNVNDPDALAHAFAEGLRNDTGQMRTAIDTLADNRIRQAIVTT